MVEAYFESAAMIVTLVLLGQVMEIRARKQTGSAIKLLMGLAPKTARRIKADGAEEDVPLGEIQVGEMLRVRPGEKARLNVVLLGENGAEISRTVEYEVPVGMPPGPLYFTVADGATTNITEYRQIIGNPPRSVDQLISTVNNLRGNTKAYVRVWRAEPAYQIESSDLPDPPPSAALILGASQPGSGSILQTRNSKITELEIAAGDVVISGSKTVQVDIKE
jgi:hypothetical protein